MWTAYHSIVCYIYKNFLGFKIVEKHKSKASIVGFLYSQLSEHIVIVEKRLVRGEPSEDRGLSVVEVIYFRKVRKRFLSEEVWRRKSPVER